MVRIKIREVAESKGISNPHQLMKATGLNYAQCYVYWNGAPKQLGVDAINRLCTGLGVTPGQLFEFERDADWPRVGATSASAKKGNRAASRKRKRR